MKSETTGGWRPGFGVGLAAIVIGALSILSIFPARFPSDGDEIFQMRIIRAPAAEVWSAIRSDRYHPPLDYLVDWELERILPGICERRIPVIVWGALAVGVFGLTLKRLAGPPAGLVAAALLATSPGFVAECRRLRPYSLGILALLVAFLLLEELVRSPTWARAGAFVASGVFSAWSLDLAALFVAVAAILVGVVEISSGDAERRARVVLASRRVAVLAVPGFLACTPLVPFLRSAVAHPVMGQAPKLTVGRSLRVISFTFVSPDAGYSFPPKWLFAAAVALAATGLVAGTFVCFRRSRWRVLPLWAGCGYLLMEALQRFHPEYDSFRYFLPIIPAMVGTVAIAWSALYRRRRAAAALLLGVALSMAGRSLARYYRFGQWGFSSGNRESGPGIR